jgi:hypothetical protein
MHTRYVTTPSGTIYRSETGLFRNARTARVTIAVAVTLLLVGGGLLLAGIAGLAGVGSIHALAITVLFGLGMVGIGAGAFLLLLREAVHSDR